MQSLPALRLPVPRRTSPKCWAIWTETPEYSGHCRTISPVRPRVLASVDRGILRWSYPLWSFREATFGAKERAPGERPRWDHTGPLIPGDRARYDGCDVPSRTVPDQFLAAFTAQQLAAASIALFPDLAQEICASGMLENELRIRGRFKYILCVGKRKGNVRAICALKPDERL